MTAVMIVVLTTAGAYAAPDYADVPGDSWAAESINLAYEYGLMQGSGGIFGYGKNITRAEFVTVLSRLLSWDTDAGGENCFKDISSHWAREYINAAAEYGAVVPGGNFRPNNAITRQEAAVTLVSALGYSNIAESAESWPLQFTDISEDAGYISVACGLGLMAGITETEFGPDDSITREEAADMFVSIYSRLNLEVTWSHAFYAISSYSQIDMAGNFDAVSLGWCSMKLDEDNSPYLDTDMSTSTYYIPSSYASVIGELNDSGVRLHLSVYMDTSQTIGDSTALSILLSDGSVRSQAIDAIMDEVTRVYDDLGYNPYSGVTIDFEGIRSSLKDSFTQFVNELEERLSAAGMTLYVAVMPATADGIYYDGYDYRAIGDAADKVILMAHDYGAKSLKGYLGTTYYRNTALTPISSVYYALSAICDSETGVQDKSKITLALSLGSLAWEVDENGLLENEYPLVPTHEIIYSRLMQGAEMGWSETYGNPYLTYTTEDGQNIFLWYEDERSVSEKVSIAKMFGITGVSVWRLGLIPAYDDEGMYYNVLNALS